MKRLITTLLALILTAPLVVASGDGDAREFKFIEFELDSLGNLHWTTENEGFSEIFFVEQYIYNRWTTLAMINGEGHATGNDYEFRVANMMHSGTNSFRIRKEGQNYIDELSEVIEIDPNLQRVYHFEKKDRILLSKRVYYCLYSDTGILIKKDYGSVIRLNKLVDKTFYLCYDNNVVLIKKNFLSF